MDSVTYARWLNAATGGFSGVVKVGAEYHDAGLGGSDNADSKNLPTGFWWQDGAKMVSTCWGVREASDALIDAGRLRDQLKAMAQSAKSPETQKVIEADLALLDQAIRRMRADAEVKDLVATIRARLATPKFV